MCTYSITLLLPGMRYREAICEVGNIFAAGSNLVGDLSSRYDSLVIADNLTIKASMHSSFMTDSL